MLTRGSPEPLGASADADGVNFAIYSERASAVELCLYNVDGAETARHRLAPTPANVWCGYLPGCRAGQHYGYRVHGRYAPEEGLRFNPNKLLLDPYARQISGPLTWSESLFGYAGDADDAADDDAAISVADSAAAMPKGIVRGAAVAPRSLDRRRRWEDSIIYEANVRGFTMRHPALTTADKGTFRGLTNAQVLDYLSALGITAIELMPVHAFVDERFLTERGLRNFWGYNTLSFFAPEPRYLGGGDVDEFRVMVDAIHERGIEVILDVVYNHTAEGNRYGPTLSFRGIDNLSYYRTLPEVSARYINDTGVGNTVNIDHPRVQTLVLDSLRYWHTEMGVDGFRFDLASILGRTASGFTPEHEFFRRLDADPPLRGARLIAEPWDVGPGGYQLGNFPLRWAEWNDRYRDGVRRFWRGEPGQIAEFARRVHGSSDIFEHSGRGPGQVINFITSHDGYTLRDLVSYESRHNLANGEDNRDGHEHNFSHNHGVEGPTEDTAILALRRRQRLNMLATLLLSQGTPMLLAGDEFGNTQHGNNNAYAQDNETGWLDWSGLDGDPEFTASVRELIRLRHSTPLLRQSRYLHGRKTTGNGWLNIGWFAPDGNVLQETDWLEAQALAMRIVDTRSAYSKAPPAVAVLFNAADSALDFTLPPDAAGREWRRIFSSDPAAAPANAAPPWPIEARSIACFALGLPGPDA